MHRTRFVFLTAATFLAAPCRAEAQFLELSPELISDTLFAEVLNYGQVRDLNKSYRPEEEHYLMRLWAVPRNGFCVRGTEYICSHRYYLALSHWGEFPDHGVFALGELGEITDVTIVQHPLRDHITLRIEVLNYSEAALAASPELPRQVRRYELDVSLDSILVRPGRQ